jgi:hypothetical protein
VYSANNQLHLRSLDQLEPSTIRGDRARLVRSSPDSQWVGFWQDGQLKKVSVSAACITLCALANAPVQRDLGADDMILFSQSTAGIWQVPAAGGTPPAIRSTGSNAHGPQLLPGRPFGAVYARVGFN